MNKDHWFGTDGLGRDVFVRVLFGARVSLLIAFVATVVNFFIGVVYGGIAGYFGGNVDNLMMRFVDIISTIPLILYVILISVVSDQPGLTTIIIAIGLVFWVRMARIVRGQVLSIKEQEYIFSSKNTRCKYNTYFSETFNSQCHGSNYCISSYDDSFSYLYRSILELHWFRC